MWITFIYKEIVMKEKQIPDLNYRGECDRIVKICQSELTNHTHVTVHVPTAFVLVLQRKLDALFCTAAELKAAHV